jgi:hypothetical protein
MSYQKTTSIFSRVEKLKSLKTNGLRDFYLSFGTGKIAHAPPSARRETS